ncbi:MAG: hypothetical protein D6791_10040, partial [Chloroflexi bacterium]
MVAIFLNPFSEQGFEPDKIALFRALVMLMVAAWVIWGLDRRSSIAFRQAMDEREGDGAIATVLRVLRDIPVAGLAVILLVIYLVATFVSVSPRLSWWGSYQRLQGTYTLLSYLGLFAMVTTTLRRWTQLQRLTTVLLFTSLPVAVYAVFQHYGVSLFQFSGGATSIEERVISTFGNPIFLAAYLAMVLPLTMWRLLEWANPGTRAPAYSVLGIMLYGGLFVLQLSAIVFTQSRGPILGLLAELFVLVLLVAFLRRRRTWAVASLLVAVVVAFLLVGLNLPGLPASVLGDLPVLQRFEALTASGSASGTVQYRVLVWNATLDAIHADPARVLIGYGPQTMKSVFNQFAPAGLWVLGGKRYGTTDQAHNVVYDTLFDSGVLGVLAYLLLYGVLFYQTLRWLGLVESRREATTLISLLALGGLFGLMIPPLWSGDLTFVGIGVSAGMVAGLLLYVLGKSLLAPSSAELAREDSRRLLIAALFAAIVGHFVEMQTGIGIAATRSYFWLYMALIILLGTDRITGPMQAQVPRPKPATRSKSSRGRRGRRRERGATLVLSADKFSSVVALSLVATVPLGSLSYAFVHGLNLPASRGAAQVLIGITWLAIGLIILLERGRVESDTLALGVDALVYAVTTLVWLLPFALYHRMSVQTPERAGLAFLVFVAWLALTALGVAVALPGAGASLRPTTTTVRLILYAALVMTMIILVWLTDLTRIRADVHFKIGKTAMEAGRWDQAIPNFQQAVRLQPEQDRYSIFLGGAFVEQARLASDPATKDAWIEEARKVFEHGWELAPGDSDHPRQLGLMYRTWAGWAPDETTRNQRLQESLKHFQAAVDLNPQSPGLRLELAGAFFELGMNEEALAQYQRVVDIGARDYLGQGYAGLGDVYLALGQLNR